MPSRARAAAAANAMLGAMLGVAGCAHPSATAAGSGVARIDTATVGFGTIASIRPVPAQFAGAVGVGGVHRSILDAIGAAGRVPQGPTRAPAVEFIIRAADGRTLSVVQGNDLHFHPGEQVVLTDGAPGRLARAAPTGT
jgi:outer membrane lipoprotein SlyB